MIADALKMVSRWIPLEVLRQVVRNDSSEDIGENFSDGSEWELSAHEESNSGREEQNSADSERSPADQIHENGMYIALLTLLARVYIGIYDTFTTSCYSFKTLKYNSRVVAVVV